MVLWIVVWQFPSCIIPARKDPSLNPSFFGYDQLVQIHTHTDLNMPVILHKAYLFHLCKKTFILLCQKKRASQMGRRGNGIWNSCHRPLVSAETLLLTTTSWQHLKFPNLPKTFLLSNCLNRKTDRDNVKSNWKICGRWGQSFIIAAEECSKISTKWIYCRQHKCTCRKLYFRQNGEIFVEHQQNIFSPSKVGIFAKFLFFSSLACFLFREAQTARPWELGSDCRGFEFLSFPVRGLMFGKYTAETYLNLIYM